MRFVVIAILVLLGVQAGSTLVDLVPDACAEECAGDPCAAPSDPCPPLCALCPGCCALQVLPPDAGACLASLDLVLPFVPPTDSFPMSLLEDEIFHVPKAA